MADTSNLTADQLARIEATLTRIRAGLAAFRKTCGQEPATTFNAEAFNDRHS
ncbi:hypothetical protein [Roseibium sp. M-1]